MSVTTSALLERRPLTLALSGSMIAVALVTAVASFVTSPEPLPVDNEVIRATIPAGQSVYLGVFEPAGDFDRTIRIEGIKVSTTSTSEVTVVPLLCRGGTVGVTVEPQQDCPEVLDPEDQDVSAGDGLVLQVTGREAAIAVIDRIEVTFSDGFRRATLEAGSPAEVRILPA